MLVILSVTQSDQRMSVSELVSQLVQMMSAIQLVTQLAKLLVIRLDLLMSVS